MYRRFAWRLVNSFRLFSFSNHRPSQHGADLLSLLSKLLDENTKPGETENHSSVVTVSLALQALEELCKAEVCMVNAEEHKTHANPCDQLGLIQTYIPWKVFTSLYIVSKTKYKADLLSVYQFSKTGLPYFLVGCF